MEIQFIALLVFLLQAIINGVNLTMAQPPGPGQQMATCQNGNFKSDILQKYRDSAFETLSTYTHPTGYYYTRNGTNKKGEEVYARGLCPPNVNADACRDCIKQTISFLKEKCPKQNEGVAYTSLVKLDCMVHYSDQLINAKSAQWSIVKFWSPSGEFIKDIAKGLNDLASKLKDQAAGGDLLKKFASGSVVYGPDSRTLYGSMQCVPDLIKEECGSCLNDAVKEAHTCCTEKGKVSGKCMKPNCYVRYSHTNYLPKNSWADSANSLRENV